MYKGFLTVSDEKVDRLVAVKTLHRKYLNYFCIVLSYSDYSVSVQTFCDFMFLLVAVQDQVTLRKWDPLLKGRICSIGFDPH